MAFSLGSIFVELKANTAQFLDGMSKAGFQAGKTGRDIDTAFGKIGAILAPLGPIGGRMAGMFSLIGQAAAEAGSNVKRFGLSMAGFTAGAGILAGVAGAAVALASHAAEAGSKIYDASVKSGIAAAQLSGLMAVAKETGGDFDSLTASLARAGANLEKAILEPAGKTSAVFAQLMGSSKALADLGLKPMGDRIQTVLSRIFALTDTGQRNLALSQLLGRGWMANVDALRLLATQGYGPAIEQAKKFGIFFDTQSAADAKRFRIAMADLKAELSGVALSLGTKLIPAVTSFLTTMNSLGARWEAYGHAVAGFYLALSGIGLPLAVKEWEKYKAGIKEADQSDTDFLVHLQDLTRGEKASGEETAKLTGATSAHTKVVKEKHDALADLIARQRDEVAELNLSSEAQRGIQSEYNRTVREIEKAVKAGGDYNESLIALDLALDIYVKKVAEANAEKFEPPVFKMPETANLGGLVADVTAATQLRISEIARLASAPEATAIFTRTLTDMANLSTTSFRKLAAVFPDLTEREVAATEAGQRLVAQLVKFDKLDLRGFAAVHDADIRLIQEWDAAALRFGSFTQKFKALGNELVLEGQNTGGKIFATMFKAVDDLSSKLAEFVVTGKADFKSLFQALEADILKAGFQQIIGGIAGKISSVFHVAIPGLGGKPAGSRADPIYTRSADALGGILGGLGGGKTSEPSTEAEKIQASMSNWMSKVWSELGSVFHSITSDLGSVLKAIGSIAKSTWSFFVNTFGGFLAAGGPVEPGRAYIVGEHHPEFFLPRQAGQVLSDLPSSTRRPVVVNQTWNITTPDADSFRRTQSQLIYLGGRAVQTALARNG